jgi:hypothetical protein
MTAKMVDRLGEICKPLSTWVRVIVCIVIYALSIYGAYKLIEYDVPRAYTTNKRVALYFIVSIVVGPAIVFVCDIACVLTMAGIAILCLYPYLAITSGSPSLLV